MQEDQKALNRVLAQCKRGKRKSQKQLYKMFYGYGMNIALRFSQNRGDSEEILNDSFLKVFSNLDKFDKQKSFKAWFRKILIRTAIDHYRSKKMSQGRIVPFSESQDIEAQDDLLIQLFPEGEVLPAIQSLPPTYRLVFNLYVMEGYKHKEIAKKLGISETTSRSNLSRARLALRKWMSKYATELTESYSKAHE